MPQMATPCCMLCGSEQARPLFVAQDWLYGLPVEGQVLCCEGCGLAYLWPQPEDLGATYPEQYAPHQPGNADVARSVGQRGGLARKARLVRQLHDGGLLDVGCAAGEFLATVRALDDRPVWGVDRSEDAVRRGRRCHGLDLWVGDVPGLPLGPETVGLVTMWHVLEHLSQPRLALLDLARVLTQDGVLVLACPMVDSWEAALFGRYWAGFDVPRHLYAFSRQTLPRLLAQAGFDAQEVPGIVLGFNSLKISSALWLRGRLGWPDSGLLRRAAAILAAGGTLVSEGLSRLSRIPGSVGVYVARKHAERPSVLSERQG